MGLIYSRPRTLLVALLMPLLATIIQWSLWDEVTPFTWFFYYPAAFIAALIGGLRGGILATLLSALLGYYLFNPPYLSFRFEKISALISTGMFIVMGVLFGLFHERSRALGQKAARRESEERLAAFMEALPAHAWMKDEKGRYVYANSLLQREVMAGKTDYKGLTDFDLFSWETAEVLRNNDKNVFSTRQPLDVLEDTRSADGITRHWHSFKFPFTDAANRRYIGGVSIEITHTKQTEEALRVAKSSLELAQQAAGVGTWNWDIRAGKLEWSPEVFRLFGLEPGKVEASFDTWRSVLHEEDRDNVRQQIDEAVQEHKRMQSVFRVVLSTGAARWIHALGNTIYDEDATPQRVTGIYLDITERKLAEAALRESEARLKFALETTSTGAWELDLRNHTAHRTMIHDRIFGYQALLPRWTYEIFLEHVLPEDREEVDRSFRKATAAQANWSFECRIRRADGEVRWIWAAGGHRRNLEGSAVQMSGIVKDITERKIAEERLKESELFSRTVLASLPTHVAILNKTGTIIAVNDVWTNFALANGARAGAGVGDSYIEVCQRAASTGDEIASRTLEGLRSILEGRNEHFELEYPCHSPTEFRWFLLRAKPLKTSAGGLVVSHGNITQLKRAETKLRRINRTLQMLSECNQVLLRSADETELLQAICSVAVETGSYRMAWVGMAEQDEVKSVRPVAKAGFETGYLDAASLSWDDTERGGGPTGKAIRTGQAVIAQTFSTDPTLGPWREAALARGYAASAALPIKHESIVLGALTVYRSEPDSFDPAEIELLTTLADNIAYGLTALRMREQERVARDELHLLSARLLQVQDVERRHLARELHDTTAQHLAVLGLKLADLRDSLEQGPDGARDLCAGCLELAKRSAQEIRTQSYLLHPPMLEVLGLIEAVDDFIQGFCARSGIKVGLKVSEDFGRLPNDVELTLFRIVQESLSNVFKHSRSPEAEIHFSRLVAAVRVEIRDAGHGIPADMLRRIKYLKSGLGVGLGGMQERLRHLGGQLDLESGPTGTTIRATLPLSSSLQQQVPTT